LPPWPARSTTRAESMNRRGSLDLGVLAVRLDAHAAAVLADARVADVAFDQREKRVVTPEADARSWRDLGAALSDQDRAGVDGLARIDLHAEHLRVGVAAVAW